jgi:hypothetical protein
MLVFNQKRVDMLTQEEISNYEQECSSVLSSDLPSITQNMAEIKRRTGANNFTSLATYYHPNPDSATGFPYVRIDGERNVASRESSDNVYFGKFYSIFTPCCIVYRLTKSEDYSIKAIEALRTFFIDENTKMNPDLTYSGIVIGDSMEDIRIRGAIIDTNSLSILPDLMELLKPSPNWTMEIENGMVSWFESLVDWFKNNPRGVLQAGYSHNIKTSYVKQLCSYLCFCGKQDEAKAYLEENLKDLLSAQIDGDGKQVLEMERVKNKHYSNFNLTLLVDLATISNSLGVNVWDYEDAEGKGSIKKAMKYMCHYHLHPEEWTASDENSSNPAAVRKWLQAGSEIYDDQILSETMRQVAPYTPVHMQSYVFVPSSNSMTT